MSEKELAKIFRQHDDYIDTLLGLIEPHDIEIELLKFRKNLRNENPNWNKTGYEDLFYKIEAKTFLKYLELCQKEK